MELVRRIIKYNPGSRRKEDLKLQLGQELTHKIRK